MILYTHGPAGANYTPGAATPSEPSMRAAASATAQERAELWPQVVRTYRGYAGYQRNTDREIPLLICRPRA